MRGQLLEQLAVSSDDCIAFIGGGGKTTAMLALAAELAAVGAPCVVTTTTKIWPPADVPLVLQEGNPDFISEATATLDRRGQVAIGHNLTDRGKLAGVSGETVEALRSTGAAVLVEADGSAGRPLKVHATHEPVIPHCATLVVAVAGLDVLGMPVGLDSVHRLDPFLTLTGADPGDPIGEEHVIAAVSAMTHRIAPSMRRAVLLNKLDSPQARVSAGHIASTLCAGDPDLVVLPTIGGRPVARHEAGAIA
jgi:probable selenium-dependent hydroxylase accessory protein YqeC